MNPEVKAKLTPWYPGNVKPVRVGVYLRKRFFFDGSDAFSYWDGEAWHYAERTAIGAARNKRASGVQRCPWRGLASNPKGGKS